ACEGNPGQCFIRRNLSSSAAAISFSSRTSAAEESAWKAFRPRIIIALLILLLTSVSALRLSAGLVKSAVPPLANYDNILGIGEIGHCGLIFRPSYTSAELGNLIKHLQGAPSRTRCVRLETPGCRPTGAKAGVSRPVHFQHREFRRTPPSQWHATRPNAAGHIEILSSLPNEPVGPTQGCLAGIFKNPDAR